METTAIVRGVRLSAQKGRLVADLVRGKPVDKALNILTFTQKRAAVLIKKACNLEHASGVPNKTKVASMTKAQVREIAELKMPDLNAASVESAMRMVEGTARSMGVTIAD